MFGPGLQIKSNTRYSLPKNMENKRTWSKPKPSKTITMTIYGHIDTNLCKLAEIEPDKTDAR